MFVCPNCGNAEFFAHQVCHVDVIVDGNNYFQDNAGDDFASSVYDADEPYGPYECTSCGYEVDALA